MLIRTGVRAIYALLGMKNLHSPATLLIFESQDKTDVNKEDAWNT